MDNYSIRLDSDNQIIAPITNEQCNQIAIFFTGLGVSDIPLTQSELIDLLDEWIGGDELEDNTDRFFTGVDGLYYYDIS